MVPGFTVEQYRPQFADEKLTATANLLAIEPYGHGQTRASYEQFTYWDSAIANLQVLDALDIPEAFVLGTSQGGWIAARMAILAPDTVKGIIPPPSKHHLTGEVSTFHQNGGKLKPMNDLDMPTDFEDLVLLCY